MSRGPKKSDNLEGGIVAFFVTSVKRLFQPQPPDPQEPEEQPPPPMELVDVIPKPERGPASINSTLIDPQVFINPSSTRNVRSSWS
jgi:hypothetical protein